MDDINLKARFMLRVDGYNLECYENFVDSVSEYETEEEAVAAGQAAVIARCVESPHCSFAFDILDRETEEWITA